MGKNDFREFFHNVKPILKLNYFCKVAKISPVSLSRFMKDSNFNYELSLDALQRLYNVIIEHLEKIG